MCKKTSARLGSIFDLLCECSGSVKANIGHLEGGSGLAGVLKSILILERGIIPPNALFERPNPRLNHESYHIKVCVVCNNRAWVSMC
jgi:acyl transferase domain-containing protein